MQELPQTVSCFLKNLGQSALRNVQFGFTLNGRARSSVYQGLGPERMVAIRKWGAHGQSWWEIRNPNYSHSTKEGPTCEKQNMTVTC
jgi:hypothetical protein